MIRVIQSKYRLHQFDKLLWIAVLVEPWGWIETDLHKSWYGYLLGFTEPFEDEAAANYGFEAACSYFKEVCVHC